MLEEFGKWWSNISDIANKINQDLITLRATNTGYAKIDELTNILFILISMLVALRIIQCLFKISQDLQLYKKRIKNAIIFYIISLTIYSIKSYVLLYIFR